MAGRKDQARTLLDRYFALDPAGTAPATYGGYSEKIVVTEHFVIRIPPGMDLAATAPLLCAGITTFSPFPMTAPRPGLKNMYGTPRCSRR